MSLQGDAFKLFIWLAWEFPFFVGNGYPTVYETITSGVE